MPEADRDIHGPLPRVDRISTRHLPPLRRFDFWRSLNFRVDLDLPDRDRLGNYQAELVRYLLQDGTEFGCGASDDTIARFSAPDGDFVMLSMAISGKVGVRLSGEETVITPASGLSVVDAGRPLETITQNHSHVYLTLSRKMIDGLFGSQGDMLDKGLLSLQRTGLACLLEAHLQAMATGGELDPRSAAVALKAAVDLALGSLAQASADGRPLDPEKHGDALYSAARRYISLHIGSSSLTAAHVAAAIGCSRAQLFRVFSRQGRTVRGVLEDERFERAARLLAIDLAMPVEQVAALCGFSGGTTFARSFRRRFGESPTSFRAMRDTSRVQLIC